jgi:GNAT superfamily N-acetyltransferase
VVLPESARAGSAHGLWQSRRVSKTQQTSATIRPAGVGDSRDLAGLRWTWRAVEVGERGMSEEAFVTAFTAWYGDHLQDHRAFLAEVDGRVVGMACLAIFDRVPGPLRFVRLAGLVQSVYVIPEVRDQGIGRLLVEAVIAEARDRKLEFLIVHPSERAFSLYRRLGFAVTDSLLHLPLR